MGGGNTSYIIGMIRDAIRWLRGNRLEDGWREYRGYKSIYRGLEITINQRPKYKKRTIV